MRRLQNATKKLLDKEEAVKKQLPGWVTETNTLTIFSRLIHDIWSRFIPNWLDPWVKPFAERLQQSFKDVAQPLGFVFPLPDRCVIIDIFNRDIQKAMQSTRDFVNQSWVPIEKEFVQTVRDPF